MATNFSPCKGSYVLNQFPSNVMFGMNGFHVSASGAIQGHHGPLVHLMLISDTRIYQSPDLKPVHINSFPNEKFKLFQTEGVCRQQYKLDENGRQFFKQVENTLAKGEIGHYEQFFLSPLCLQKIYTADV